MQTYSQLDSCCCTPTASGNYLLTVTAEDLDTGVEVSTVVWYSVTDLTRVTVLASQASPQALDTPITLTATAIQYEIAQLDVEDVY